MTMKTLLLSGRRLVIGVPYVWLLVFFALPFLILLRISITDMGASIDPFTPLLDRAGDSWRLLIKPQNYLPLFTDGVSGFGDTIYIQAYQTSLKYAAFTTLFASLLATHLPTFWRAASRLFGRRCCCSSCCRSGHLFCCAFQRGRASWLTRGC